MLHEITFKNNVYNVSYKKRERERKAEWAVDSSCGKSFCVISESYPQGSLIYRNGLKACNLTKKESPTGISQKTLSGSQFVWYQF